MKLENIEQAKAKTGAAYWILTIDGKKYNMWKEPSGIAVGDEVVCEFETKGQYTNLKSIVKGSGQSSSSGNQGVPSGNIVLTGLHDLVIMRSEKPNSYEFGKAQNRHKVFYSTIDELKAMIKALQDAGLTEDVVEIEKIE